MCSQTGVWEQGTTRISRYSYSPLFVVLVFRMQHIPSSKLFQRALKLRCLRCGEGKMFAHLFRMHTHCPSCDLKFERGDGYFLGSTYINYGLTALIVTSLYLFLHFGRGIDDKYLAIPLTAICLLFPLLFFRYARSIWMAIDCSIDKNSLNDD